MPTRPPRQDWDEKANLPEAVTAIVVLQGDGLWWAQDTEKLAMDYVSTLLPAMTIGVDLGDKTSEVYSVGGDGVEREMPAVRTTRDRVEAYFGEIPPARIVIECGMHSPWVSRVLEGLGHQVIVANTRQMPRRQRKFDKMDARNLAREGRVDPRKLYPIRHRGLEAQTDLALLRARRALVRARTLMVNHVRGVVKSFGYRVPSCGSEAFANVAKATVPDELREALGPLIQQIRQLTKQIRRFDAKVEAKVKKYPEIKLLRQVKGVGPVTSLAFVLLIEDPKRFEDSRDVGAYFGLVSRVWASGASNPQLRITKAGDEMMRSLLTNAAHYILGPFGPDCDLRRYGEKMAARGGKNAKKRAVSAVARRLSVLLHVLWKKGAVYEPLRNTGNREGAEALRQGQRPRHKMTTGRIAVSNC